MTQIANVMEVHHLKYVKMSTRANIKITKSDPYCTKSIILYRHCDGYPEDLGLSLCKCLSTLKDCKEYNQFEQLYRIIMHDTGSEESDNGIHGDIDYYYDLDLADLDDVKFKTYKVDYDSDDNQYFTQVYPDYKELIINH